MLPIRKYIWVVETIRRAGRITLKELNDKWRDNDDLSMGKDLPRQTFDRWKGCILDLFGIIIDCERGGLYRYYIANPKVLDSGDVQAWLYNTYSALCSLSGNMAVYDRILAENVPSSQTFLKTVLGAMKANAVLQITHRSFGEGQAKTHRVEPYSLKLSSQRWYLLARCVEINSLRLYSLDRLESTQITDEKFEMPEGFDAKKYFSEFFGIVIDGEVPLQRVVIRADKDHKYYMRTLPLHSSQREIYACDEYADFELTLRPTYDFYMKLMSFGDMVKVIAPQELQQEICRRLKNTLDVYK
mgnify:FL=1